MKHLSVIALICLCALAVMICVGCQRAGDSSGDLRVAFFGGSFDYWTIARRGVEQADKELEDLEAEYVIPVDSTAASQRRLVDDLLAKGMDAIAITPVDPANQTQMLNEVAKQTLLITEDNDAPASDRACYVGTNNVEAGRQAGTLLKEVLPNGGRIMLFVGQLDAQNARDRLQGIKEVLAGTNIEILDVRTDATDTVRAKANVADAIAAHPDLAGLVGLWAYNGPAILSAVRDAGKVGQIEIVCFDEEDITIEGVRDGSIHGTVVQQPFELGYQSVKLMHSVLRGDRSVIPASKQIFIPTLVVRKNNVEEFAAQLKQLRGRS